MAYSTFSCVCLWFMCGMYGRCVVWTRKNRTQIYTPDNFLLMSYQMRSRLQKSDMLWFCCFFNSEFWFGQMICLESIEFIGLIAIEIVGAVWYRIWYLFFDLLGCWFSDTNSYIVFFFFCVWLYLHPKNRFSIFWIKIKKSKIKTTEFENRKK